VNGAFVGNWTPVGSDHADPVRLAAMKRPACDGHELWKRFDDPKWPVSFSYPSSWHIKEDGDALELICPDPEAMTVDDAGVTIYEGKGEPGGPEELVHCAKGWWQGPSCDDYDENSALFRVSIVSQQQGKTILNLDDHEWRVYCSDGGFVGHGDGADRVLLLHNYWIEFIGAGQPSEFVDRLVKSAYVRPALGAK
jgi:hypothetical protein